MDYTFEQFEFEFESGSEKEKEQAISKLLDSNIDISDPEIKEKLKEYRAQLQDYYNDLEIEGDKVCNEWIELGKAELYTCIKDLPQVGCLSSCSYYIRIDDIRGDYSEKLRGIDNPEIEKYISSLKNLHWIILDDGIGTLKYHRLFPSELGDFNNYFSK